MQSTIDISHGLAGVKYEIRGRLSRRADELERQGYEIISNPLRNRPNSATAQEFVRN